MQMQKLGPLIKYAYTNVPYYRNLFDQAGVKPQDIKIVSAISKIPITRKADFQRVPLKERIASGTDLGKCLNLRTSGSTGLPLDIFVTGEEHLRSKTLLFLNMFLENGCHLTDKILRIATPAYMTKKRWFQHLGILREYFIFIFDDINVQLNTFLQTKPQALRGYTSGIKSLALKIRKSGIKITPPKIVFTTAEMLSKGDRSLIVSEFQAQVIDYYCCNEIGIIASECKEHMGYHINHDNAIVEFIKQDGTPCKFGEEGEMVVTCLNRLTMPFIRYKIGDRAIPTDKRCSCGKASRLIDSIIGRDNDQVILSDGTTISPYLLVNTITDSPGVIEFQIVQKELGKIAIYVVKSNGISDDALSYRVKKQFQEASAGKIQTELFIVKEISKDKTGKMRIVKNEISGFRSSLS